MAISVLDIFQCSIGMIDGGTLISERVGDVSLRELHELERRLKGFSRGRFPQLLFLDTPLLGREYIGPIKFMSESDVEKVLATVMSSEHGVPIGPMIKEDLGAAIGEILMNACMHSESKVDIVFVGEYVCDKDTLNISIYDRGVGFRSRIADYLGENSLTSREAILWALKEGHSIDKSSRTSGLGLNETVDFMRRNGGLLEIISGNACWQMFCGDEKLIEMPKTIKGSLVNFSIVIDNSRSYLKQVVAEFPKEGLKLSDGEGTIK